MMIKSGYWYQENKKTDIGSLWTIQEYQQVLLSIYLGNFFSYIIFCEMHTTINLISQNSNI
jgi:hypothetical protein